MPNKNPSTPAPNPSPGSRRQELAAQNAKAAREHRIRRRVGLTLMAAVAATVVVAIAWITVSAPPTNPDPGTAAAVPGSAGGSDAWTVQVGQADAPVRVSVYQDFMCPFCGRFETANGEELKRLVAEGTVLLEIHPMSFLDQASNGARYSTRTANAFVTAAKADPDSVLAFNSALYASQPPEGSAGLTDAEIAQLALAAGVDDSVVATFTQMANADWVAQGTQADFDSGITGTPTVLIDGQVFGGDLYNTGPVTAAIESAAND